MAERVSEIDKQLTIKAARLALAQLPAKTRSDLNKYFFEISQTVLDEEAGIVSDRGPGPDEIEAMLDYTDLSKEIFKKLKSGEIT